MRPGKTPRRGGTLARRIGIGTVLALLACIGLALFQGAPASPPKALPRTSEPEKAESAAPVVQDEGFLGVVLPLQAVDITSRVDGRLARLTAQVGARVREGAELGSLDTRALRRELAVAEAVLAGAVARERQAEIAVAEKKERLERVLKPMAGALSEEEISTARYQHETALAELAVAQANTQQQRADLERIQFQMEESRLLMPFNGVIAARFVDPGTVVRSGTPVVRVIQQSGLRVRFAVPEDAGGLAEGLPVNVVVPGLDSPLPGRVSSVAPEVDAASRMIFAMATVETPAQVAPPAAGVVVRVQPGQAQASAEDRGSRHGRRSGRNVPEAGTGGPPGGRPVR
jgi:membrane fusion protein (multidrug efflux system)/multidrug efflux system membrane fusion protein